MNIESESNPPIVFYCTSSWSGIWRPRHEFALLLSELGWPLIYTGGPFTIWDTSNDDWRSRPWLGNLEQKGRLIVDNSGRLPLSWPGRIIDKPVLYWHAKKMKSALRIKGDQPLIALVFDPAFLPHVDQLNPKYTVYFQYEALSRLPGLRDGFHEQERRLVDRSDLIVSLSPQMADTLPGLGPSRAKILPSAVRIESFLDAGLRPCPLDLACIPTPRIGYIGSITIALDFDLILSVASARPDWQFVFIGPVERDGSIGSLSDPISDGKWQHLRTLPNVHYLPQKPSNEVPSYMAHMQVNALWYRTSGGGWWLLGSPLKMYENLAVGIPVVGSSLAAIREYSEVVLLADTTDEWVSAITRALDEPTIRQASQRISVAKENSWKKRVNTLDLWLQEMIAYDGAPLS